jgi:hypothetical protein
VQAQEVAEEQRREVDADCVVVQADEVKVKAQPHTKQKMLLVFTAVVMTAVGAKHFSAATTPELWRQVGAYLAVLGVHQGRLRMLALADGAKWIRDWFEGLGLRGAAMVLCWWHLVKRCEQLLSMACRGREHREGVQAEVVGHLWEGRVDEAVAALAARRGEMKNQKAFDELLAYLKARRPYIPSYKARKEAGLWIASTRVEKLNDWSVSERCKGRGMSWTVEGVNALAALEMARRNNELTHWRRTDQLTAWDTALAA